MMPGCAKQVAIFCAFLSVDEGVSMQFFSLFTITLFGEEGSPFVQLDFFTVA